MGAIKSKLEDKKGDSKPKVENDFANDPNDNEGNETPKDAVEPNINSDNDEDLLSDDDQKHNKNLDDRSDPKADDTDIKDIAVKKDINENAKTNNDEDQVSEDIIKTVNETGNNKSIQENICPSTEHAKGIISNTTHICIKGSKFQMPDITDEELTKNLDKSLDNAVNNSDRLLGNKKDVENEDGQIAIQTSTVEVVNSKLPPRPEEKLEKHVTWSTKVKAKNIEDGTESEVGLKCCNSCQSVVIVKEDLQKAKVKVTFSKNSSSENQEEDTSRVLYICDSCDLECSKKILKNKNQE